MFGEPAVLVDGDEDRFVEHLDGAALTLWWERGDGCWQVMEKLQRLGDDVNHFVEFGAGGTKFSACGLGLPRGRYVSVRC